MKADKKSLAGNFYNSLKVYADSSEQYYSYLKDHWSSLDEWKKQARAKVLELLCYSPCETPLQPLLISRKDNGGYIREEIEFKTTENSVVPGTVLIPGKGKGPFPPWEIQQVNKRMKQVFATGNENSVKWNDGTGSYYFAVRNSDGDITGVLELQKPAAS
ncbi:MAG: alpha/beta hydrolase family protein [Clostridiaceae bacterium]|nr:alpha/beta hydrolase family protein [Clostridiaceae bacterium]